MKIGQSPDVIKRASSGSMRKNSLVENTIIRKVPSHSSQSYPETSFASESNAEISVDFPHPTGPANATTPGLSIEKAIFCAKGMASKSQLTCCCGVQVIVYI